MQICVTHPQHVKTTCFLTFVYPCIASIIINDNQQDATILAYLFIPNHVMDETELRSISSMTPAGNSAGGQYQKL